MSKAELPVEPRTVVLHPRGNQNVRQLLTALKDENLLEAYHTTLGWSKFGLTKTLPQGVAAEIKRRSYPMLEQGELYRHDPWSEAWRISLDRLPRRIVRDRAYSGARSGVFRLAERFDQSVAKTLDGIDTESSRIVYGYEDCSADTFAVSKGLGLLNVLEVPYAHYRYARSIIEEEARRRPDFAATRPIRQHSSEREIARKNREFELADFVIVPSEQVAESLKGVIPAKQILMNRYGLIDRPRADVAASPPTHRSDKGSRLQLLFVGRLQSDKGIAYLADAWKSIRTYADLTVIGSKPGVPCPALDEFLAGVRYLGIIPRPRVLAEIRRADAFLLPSLVEGRSLAALEAISLGAVPLITRSTGAADLVEDGVSGLILEEASAESIVASVERLRDRQFLDALWKANIRPRPGVHWQDYRERSIRLLTSIVNSQ